MRIMFLMGGKMAQNDKDVYPLYLNGLHEKSILEEQINYCRPLNPSQFIFCVKQEDINKFQVKHIVEQITSNAVVIPISGQTQGAICTALLGAEYINNDEELIIMAIDDFMQDDGLGIVNTFRQNQCDAGVVSFTSIHPRYSFAKTSSEGDVIEVSEKTPISKNALVSFYYFKKGADFVHAAMNVIRKDNPVQDSFYVSQALNEMILKHNKIGLYHIENDKFHPLKTIEQLEQYLNKTKDTL